MDRKESWYNKERTNSRRGMTVSLVIHGLLLLLLLFLTTSHRQPEDEVQGILIDFGASATGFGETATPAQPARQEVREEQTVTPVTETAPATADVADEVVTQDVVEAPAIHTEDTPDPEAIAAAEQAAREQAAAEAAAQAAAEQAAAEAAAQAAAEAAAQELKDQLDQAWGSGGDGNTTPGGDQGVEDGVPDGPYNEGTSSTGLGDGGIGFDLSGRKMVKRPSVDDSSQKTGKVAVRIKVDRNGKVISAEYTSRGSTTTDAYLISVARRAAMEAKFDSNYNAPAEQVGTIFFTFRIQ